MDFGIACVAGITALCYLAAMAVKATSVDNKWLPVICGVIGATLGVVGMYTMPDYPVKDIINAAAVGAVSGLAATGINQMYKQLKDNQQKQTEASEPGIYQKGGRYLCRERYKTIRLIWRMGIKRSRCK